MVVLLLVLCLAGAVGTLARFGMQTFMNWLCGEGFPWGTFVVNILGCFLFGIVWALAEERKWLSKDASIVLLTGFMGAFTTFSTFAFDTAKQLEESHLFLAAGNVLGQVIVGIAALFLGLGLVRLF